ncbi:MAG: ATP-binding protein, partial [Thermodesulfobacteriota bacterium]
MSGILTNRTFLLFLIPVLAGALMGVLFLYPLNEFVYFHEHVPTPGTGWSYTWDHLWLGLTGHYPIKVPFYGAVGAFLGLVAALFFNSLYKSTAQIKQLSDELQKDLLALISHGESATAEFKSTFKWDLKESKPNKALEDVVLKTLAGFMNSQGGTLIIGVADDGQIVGLE